MEGSDMTQRRLRGLATAVVVAMLGFGIAAAQNAAGPIIGYFTTANQEDVLTGVDRQACDGGLADANDQIPFVTSEMQAAHDAPESQLPRRAMLVVLILLLIAAFRFFVFYISRWRLRAVLFERERLAMEMHDTLAQSFTGICFQLQSVQESIKKKELDHRQLDTALDMVRMGHQEAKSSIAALSAQSLDAAGLMRSLEDGARRLTHGGSIDISTLVQGNPRPLSAPIFDGLFRIAQEAITNAIRHSNPSRIVISLMFYPGSLHLMVKDDGTGFSANKSLMSLGTSGMEKRACELRGELQIMSASGRGTEVHVTVPLPKRRSRTFRILHSLDSIPEHFL
jgi:signal transduction histidine kinase